MDAPVGSASSASSAANAAPESVSASLFRDVKYYLSGDVPLQVAELLRSGGGEQSQYFSDFVSHLICGPNAPETDLTDASDLYEIPAATHRWVTASARANKLLSVKPYNPSKNQVFANVVVCIARVSSKDAKLLYALVTFHGGRAKLNLDLECTHLLVGSPTGSKYAAALSSNVHIVTPDWVIDSVKSEVARPCDVYHPKLLKSPSPSTPTNMHSSVSHELRGNVGGFDFEEGIAKSEVPTQNKSDTKDIERTQALVDKLKQNMPWTSATPLGNPNVVSNSVSKLTPHQNLMNQNVPKTLSNIPVGTPTSQQHGNALLQNQQNSNANVQHVALNNPPQGLTDIQMQQQRLLQQRQLRMPLQIQQNQNKHLIQNQQQLNVNQVNMGIQQQNQNLPTSLANVHNISNQQNPNVNTSINQLLQQSHNVHQQIVTTGINQNMILASKQVHSSMMNQQQLQNLTNQHQAQSNNLNSQVNQNINQHSNQIQNQQNILPIPQHQVQSHLNQQQNPNILPNQQQILNVNQVNQNITLNQQNISLNINQQNIQSPSQPNPNIGLVQQTNQMLSLNQHHNQPNIPLQNQQNPNVQMQPNWRQQQNIQMVQNPSQNALPGQQIIRGNMLQQRNQLQQNQLILQQAAQNPSQQSQLQPGTQHNIISQQNQQLMAQNNGRQMQTIQNNQQQMLVQKQLTQNAQSLLNAAQQSNANPQQILLNQQQVNNNSHQQIIPGNQHIALQNNQQIPPQGPSQIITQGNQQIIPQQMISQGNLQIMNKQVQQIIAPGQQTMPQGNQILASTGQQIVTQSHQLISQGQQIGSQGQQILNQAPQIIQQQNQPNQQVIAHQGGQQIITPGGQQGGQQMIAWQQQQFLQQRQQVIGQQGAVTQRVWTAGTGGRQLIHLDAQTHAQLQQMDPKQRAVYVAQLHKRHQLRTAQQQQSALAGQHTVTLVRGQIPPGLTQLPQGQWVQQQGVRAASLGTGDSSIIARQQPQVQQQSLQQTQQVVQPPLSQPPQQLVQQQQQHQQHQQLQQQQQHQQQQQQQFAQLQLQRQPQQHQQYPRLRLHTQIRDHAHKQGQIAPLQGGSVQVGGIPQGAIAARQIIGPALPEGTQQPDGTIVQQGPSPDQVGTVLQGAGAPPLIVHPRTKTALANMLSIRLQSTQPTTLPQDVTEPSAAGTLRLMTAVHNAPPRAPAEVVQTLQQRRASQGPILHQLPVSPHTHPQQLNKPAFNMGTPAGMVGVPGRTQTPAPPASAALPRTPFYGHNPNLKLPPDLFLLGCIFHVVEYGNDSSHNIKQWTEAVGRHGGEVELGYCARVTHVLAQTQKHGVVMQALRDSKRCVTAYWLSDTMTKRQVAPPWQALHLPLMYAPHDRPAQRHRASITGFVGEERDRVRFMIEHTGAKITTYMTRDNTVLICRRPEGPKYLKAREWNIPTVSVQWLTDLLLGNMSALTQLEHSKYQQYNVPNPFRMDHSLVPHLMNAWKMPINITQESHERVKRGALPTMSPHRAKKPRLTQPSTSPQTPITCIERPDPAVAPKVLFSSFKDIEPYSNIVRQLGGFITNQASEATHLVMGRLVRTPKFITALITVKYILSISWLTESQKIGKFAEESKFPLCDDSFNEMFKCDIPKVLSIPPLERSKLFDGITFYMTPGVQPSRSVLTEMIEMCGGKVEKNRKSYVSIQEIHKEKPYSYLVLTAMNDLHLVYYLLQPEKNLNIVCNTELVLMSIMQQKINVMEHLVKIN